MAWIESHQEIGRHPKTRHAARLAGINVAQTVGHLHLMWHWALDFAQDGDISGYGKWQIEDAAFWDGAEGVLYDAFMQAGFIETEANGVITKIHDWYEYAGKLIERRQADAARKRGDSRKNPTEPPKTSATTPMESAGTPPELQRKADGLHTGSNVTVTVPYPTLTVPTLTDTPLVPSEPEKPASDDAQRDRLGVLAGEKKKQPKKFDYPPEFDAWWSLYPRKDDKYPAFKIWKTINPDAETQAQMITAITEQSKNPRWYEDDGRFCPLPTTWLNKRRWSNNGVVAPANVPRSNLSVGQQFLAKHGLSQRDDDDESEDGMIDVTAKKVVNR